MKTLHTKLRAEKPYKIPCSLPTVLFLTVLLFATAPGFSQNTDNQVIHVKFKDQFNPGEGRSLRAARTGISKLDRVSERHGALSMERIFPNAGKYEAAHREYGLHLWYKITFKKGAPVRHAISEYRNLDYFHRVEECRDYTTGWERSGSNKNYVSSGLLSGANDPQFGNQWHYRNTGQTGGTPGADINLVEAWKTQTGSPNVIVAVIDGGININHPDLKGALWTNANETPGNRVDDDNNGYVDDVHGYNFGDRTSAIYANNHGTHVAGTIGAVSNNGIGVSGIAGGSGSFDGVRLMSCATFGAFGTGGFEDAMVYAADNGAVISQNSWGGGSSAIEAAIQYFIERAGYDNSDDRFALNIQTGPMAGGIVIFAAGNSNTSDPLRGYPGSYEKVIAVASTDHRDVRSYFSNYGSWVDIAAPGSQVMSTITSGYGSFSGTSMACPHVSGVAALIVSQLQRQGLKPEEVWNRLRLSARNISFQNPGMNGLLGAGRLDAQIALRESDAIAPDAITDLHATGVHYSSIALRWTATGESGDMGQAAEYEIRYSTAPLTSLNFDNAVLVSDPPRPPVAGEPVVMEVSDLTPGTTYHFALKSRDIFYNTSGISNVITATTASPPTPEFVTTSLSETLYSGGILTSNIFVKNVGGDDLRVRLGIPDLAPAPVGFPSDSKAKLFAINSTKNLIEQLDPKTGVVVHSVPMPEASTSTHEGLAFDGKHLFYARSRIFYKLNAHTGEVVRKFIVNIPVSSVYYGLAWSGRYLYASVYTGAGGRKLFEIDTDTGAIIRTLLISPMEITFGGKRGTLFVISGSEVQERNLSDGSLVRHIYDGTPKALAYSAFENLLFISEGSNIRVINPDTGVVVYTIPYRSTTSLTADEYTHRWATTTEDVVTIPPGAIAGIPLTFVATELATGQWTGSVNVIPVNVNVQPRRIPLQLNTTSGPDIDVTQEVNFGVRFVGFDIDSVITVHNRGISELIISDIQADDSRVIVSHSSMTLGPGEKRSLSISVASTSAGPVDATISFTTNDPDEGLLLIPIKADIKIAPAITVDPSSLSTTLATGESTTLSFTATNTGGSVLHWNTNFAGSSSPGVRQSSAEEPISESQLELDEFTVKAASPEPLTCLSYDPVSGYIYGKSSFGNNFYRYDLVANNWSLLGLTPPDFSGQATSLNGKIYHGGTQLNVYDPKTNGWSAIPFPVAMQTGNITNDGQYVYILLGSAFHRYDPSANTWHMLTGPPLQAPFVYFGPNSALSYHNGVIYAHEDTSGGITGTGNTNFRKYFIETDSWGSYVSIPGKACSTSAIDPAGRRYFALGAPYYNRGNNIQMSILDLNAGEWSTIVSPFEASLSSGLVFVGKTGVSGIYFIQGYEGTAFARYETAPASEWIDVTPSYGDLQPGETQAFNVNVSAAGLDAGTYTGKLRVSSVFPRLEGNVPLTVTVLGAPDITSSKESVNFGEIVVGEGSGARIVIRNMGTAILNVASITSDQPEFTASASSFSVQTGESISVTAYFNPTSTGNKTGKLIFHTNDPDESQVEVSLEGSGVPPAVPVYMPDTIDVDIFSGTIAVHDINLTNAGGALLYYGVGFDTYNDWLRVPPGGPLNAGETTAIPLVIDASNKGTGTHNKTLVFFWHRGATGESYMPVTIRITDAPGILTNTDSIEYGETFLNKEHDSILEIRNAGVMPLSIIGIHCENPAFTLLGELPSILNPSENVQVTVRFKPVTVSTETGTITITSDDPDNGIHLVALSGSGVEPPVIDADATIDVTAFTNESQTKTLMLGNDGGSVLRWRMEGQTSSSPSGTAGYENLPSSAGEFTSMTRSPEAIMGVTIDPETSLLYAQAPHSQDVLRYNPLSNSWSEVGNITYAGASNQTAGAVILKSEMYCVYPNDNVNIHVFNLILRTWRTMPHGLGTGTRTITTDGTLLYLAGGGKFKSLHPTKKTIRDLPMPTITLDGAGGLRYHDGVIYAHEGNNNGFAKYDISAETWETLIPLPGKAVLGSAIDPVKKRYYAYGKNDLSYLYEFDLAANLWTAVYIQTFDVSDGGMVYVPTEGVDGIYFTQGANATGLGRYKAQAQLNWVRPSPMIGEIAAHDTQDIGINFHTYNLPVGRYHGKISMFSNDPVQPIREIDVTLNVISHPSIKVPALVEAKVDRFTPYQFQVKIENTGGSPLYWNFTNSLPAFLTSSRMSGALNAFSSENILITFDPAAFSDGEVFEYVLDVNSNDPVHPLVLTQLKFNIIENHAPVVMSPINNQSLSHASRELSIASNFSDPDGDALVFAATSDNIDVVTVDVVESKLKLTPVTTGTATVTVKATDTSNASASLAFTVNVDHTVAVNEFKATGRELLATPNPFNEKLVLLYYAATPGPADIRVVDVQGKIVWEWNGYETVQGWNEIEIKASSMAPGVFTCRLLRSGRVSTVRLVRY